MSAAGRKLFKIPLKIDSFCCLKFNDLFSDFDFLFQITIEGILDFLNSYVFLPTLNKFYIHTTEHFMESE